VNMGVEIWLGDPSAVQLENSGSPSDNFFLSFYPIKIPAEQSLCCTDLEE
jgi:hypothetical protein